MSRETLVVIRIWLAPTSLLAKIFKESFSSSRKKWRKWTISIESPSAEDQWQYLMLVDAAALRVAAPNNITMSLAFPVLIIECGFWTSTKTARLFFQNDLTFSMIVYLIRIIESKLCKVVVIMPLNLDLKIGVKCIVLLLPKQNFALGGEEKLIHWSQTENCYRCFFCWRWWLWAHQSWPRFRVCLILYSFLLQCVFTYSFHSFRIQSAIN